MPYKRVGKIILKSVNGKWVKKQQASSIENAKKALRLLNMLEHRER